MRIAESLVVPDEIERARSTGNLVVFAGAGVSMDAPANLPDFRGLAREIAESVVPWAERHSEALDKYLGRAEREGVEVQARARDKLLSRGGSHTALHEQLIGIFGAPERIRLITTNFDRHFTSAAEEVFGRVSIPHYVGPALPPGRDFRGIVQLHGSLDHPQDRFVLTDGDFGAAYMAEGWAARFLVGVFAQRSVLFIGYSLGDPVMQYLMRALPQTRQWYAVCHESETERWSDHDVVAIPFRASSDGRRFGDLNDGLKRWRWYAQASPSDHDRELRRIIGFGSLASLEDADYIRARLKLESGRGAFWSNATDPRWFDWAVSEGLLDSLTDERSNDTDLVRWGRWCLENFCGGDVPPLLRFLRGRSVALHPWFLSELTLHLSRTDALPRRPVLRQLVALIVNQPIVFHGVHSDHAWLLERLVRERCAEETLALLRWMTRVRLLPVERLGLALSDSEGGADLLSLSIRVGIQVAPGDLVEFLDTHGAALASLDADSLVALGEQGILEAYELLHLARAEQDSIDWMSYGRTAIASTNQDFDSHAEDVLILLLRTALDYWSAESPGRLSTFADRHSGSAHTLLRRLALYAYAHCAAYLPDRLFDRATAEGWPRDFWSRPEFYQLLDAHYGRASEPARERFIAALHDDTWWGDGFDEHQAHARFSLSRKLLRLSPESVATLAFAEAEALAHPTWAESDADGYLWRVEVGWGGEGPSPIESEQMLAWRAGETLARVSGLLRDPARHAEHYALLGAVQSAARTEPAWGVELFQLALSDPETAERLTSAVAWGLREAACSAADQLALLQVTIAASWPDGAMNSISTLLEKWARELPDPSSAELLDAFDQAADVVYERSRTQAPGIDDDGWTERSINHPAGHAAQVWWNVANARDRVDGEFVLTVDDAERERWTRVCQDESAAGAFARPILGMLTDRLSSGDFPWTERVVFPAFDPANGVERAAQLWDGRLMQSRWTWTTVEGLQPYLPALLGASASLVPARSRELGDWVAMLVARADKPSITLAELQQFIRHATAKARHAFADALPRHVERIGGDERRQLWTKLLAPYWRDRRTNVPVGLDQDEVRGMLAWVVALPEVAPEVLEELEASKGESLSGAERTIWKWNKDDRWLREHPLEAVRIIRFIAERRSIPSWFAGHAVELLEKALELGASREQVLAAAEALVTLSSRGAADLVERLRAI